MPPMSIHPCNHLQTCCSSFHRTGDIYELVKLVRQVVTQPSEQCDGSPSASIWPPPFQGRQSPFCLAMHGMADANVEMQAYV